ncbi:MAG: hypothetical protein AAGG79_08145, partial [Pseudomonadota bacterium]
CSFKPVNDNRRVIVVARDDELRRRSYVRRLAMATRALNLPRREIPNWLADTIFGHRGPITWSGGKVFEIGDEDIDAAFNHDGSFRWLSDFLLFANRTPEVSPQSRVLSRLRLIDLAFRIRHAERAELIGK